MRLTAAAWGIAAFVISSLSGPAQADEFGLKIAPGFRVTLYADETLANDVYAMTLDAKGRVAITTQGEVKVLHDDNGDHRADRAEVYTRTPTGGMGLCFDGNDLLFCGDGWFSRYCDKDGDGHADGPAEHILPMQFQEHGGHAMRLGPDGFWYLIGGNDSGISRRHITAPESPVRNPEAGGVLRISPNLRSSEVIAHGFRNPYDFDFNAAGDLFTYDSDVEREYFLPWYTPTRMYHIAFGGHHGWRVTGYMRSWSRRDYFFDTVDMLWPVGRGSPTGVVCYRHDQFPARYQGAVFALDWTFGRIYAFPLEPNGVTYRTEPEVFIEPTGSQGFDPTDAVVAPDGTMFISIGGRKTRGSIYRVEYVGPERAAVSRVNESDIDAVLNAPQPLDAWSRTVWMPIARKLGLAPFLAAAQEKSRGDAPRVRAIEVLTELFGGVPAEVARELGKADSAPVRARLAWSIGRSAARNTERVLPTLAEDRDARVRLAALDAMLELSPTIDGAACRAAATANLAHAEKRIRQAAARLAARLQPEEWKAFAAALEDAQPESRLTAALAALWRADDTATQDRVVALATSVIKSRAEPAVSLDALRLIVLALGDYNLYQPPVEIYTAYSLPRPVSRTTANAVLEVIRPVFPSGHETLDWELSRLLAMLEDRATETLSKVASFWSQTSSATNDFHYLVVLSRLRAPRDASLSRQTAGTLLGLGGKLRRQEQRIKQTWNDRLLELVSNLIARDLALAEMIADHKDLIDPTHVVIAQALDPEHRRRAAVRFQKAVQADTDFEWSHTLVSLLAQLPASEVRPLYRAQWENYGLRDAILLQLAENPDEVDREKFLTGLDSAQSQVVAACLSALDHLPRDASPEHLTPVFRLLRRLESEPKETTLRARALAVITQQTDERFQVSERGQDAASLKKSYAPVFDWFQRHAPAQFAALERGDEADAEAFERLKKSVNWAEGQADRGEAIYRTRACQTCHSGPGRLGPDLSGVGARFSRDDLWTAIVAPNRDVAPAYRVNLIETREGKIISGVVAFESADGLIVQTGATETLRIATPDIAARLPSQRSLMPTGLLKDLAPRDVADLFAYLQTLGASQPAQKSQ
jgi:putative membrane-bound dehydrogenase-like protein